jgi:hypothetical protein
MSVVGGDLALCLCELPRVPAPGVSDLLAPLGFATLMVVLGFPE